MLLAIDIGNTNIHVGIFEKNKLECVFYMGTDKSKSGDEYAFILKSLINSNGYENAVFDAVIVGSVAPFATSKIIYAVSKITDAQITTVGPGVKTGYTIKLDNPSELGADLCANVAGAIDVVGYPAVIVDFGTATTVSAVDKDKAYVGCYIMPGIQMSLDSLSKTGLLPGVIADDEFPVIGKNSPDSMKSGVIFGQVMAAEGFIETLLNELDLPKTTNIIVTGGYAPLVIKYFRPKTRHIPCLTLLGLNAIYNTDSKKQRSKGKR